MQEWFVYQGHFIEVQVTDGALYRTKIHCYFLDQTRVIRPLPDEKNYHIFYQMLAGLSHDERGNNTINCDRYGTPIIYVTLCSFNLLQRAIKILIVTIFAVKLNLEGYNLKNLRYLQHGDTRQDEAENAIRFQAWKACLGTCQLYKRNRIEFNKIIFYN